MKQFPGNVKNKFANALMQPQQPLPTLFEQLSPEQKAKATEIIAGLDLTDVDHITKWSQKVAELLKKSRQEWLDVLRAAGPDVFDSAARMRQQEETEKQLAEQELARERLRVEGVVEAFRFGVQKAILAPDPASFAGRSNRPVMM